jgi:type I site-specific restriction endonuclease
VVRDRARLNLGAGRGNDFARKITYRTTGARPEDLIAAFRNSYYPRVAVTVDMISIGTDIKPLEVLLFLRSVKSRVFFEQMKGRCTRTISDADLRSVTPGAVSKTHFVLVDAVGVCERAKSDDPPPLGVSAEALWQAYAQLNGARVRGASARHLLTDLVSLVRYALDRDHQPATVLEPYAAAIHRRFAAWLAGQERQRGAPFSAEQQQWLELIRDHVAASLTIEREDFDDVPFMQHGGLGRATQLFGDELPALLARINEELAA